MAKKVEIEVDVKGNVVESQKNIKALKQALKEVPAGTAEWSKIKNQIRDVEDALESANASSEDFKGQLENAPGPLGALGGAIKKVELATKSWGAAFKAIGIGLLVSLIGGLVGAFSQTEGAMKKFEPLLIAMEQIFGGILEALTPVIDGFLDLAISIMPTVTKAFKVVYSAVTAVFQSLGKLGSAVVKLFKGDFAGAWEDAKSSVTSFSDNYDAATERFDKGAAKMTKTQKKNSEETKKTAAEMLADRIKNLEANDKLDAAMLEKEKQLALAEAFNDEQKLAVEKAFYEKSYQLKLKDLQDKQALYSKDSNEYKDFQSQILLLQAEKVAKDKEFKDKEVENTEKAAKEITDFEIKLAADLQKIEDKKKEDKLKQDIIDKGNRDSKFQQDMLYYRNDLDMQRQLLEEKRLADEKYYAEQLAVAGLTAEAIQQLNEKKLADENAYINSSIQLEQTRVAAKQQALDNIISIVGAESMVGKAALIAKQILIAKELVAEAKRTITFSKLAVANSKVAVAEGTAKTAKVGFPQNIPLLLGYAAQAAGIISAILSATSAAKSVSAEGGGGEAPAGNATASLGKNYGNGGMINGPLHAQGGVMVNAEGGEAIINRRSSSMFAPMLSLMNQAGGGVGFSSLAMGQAGYDAAKPTNASDAPIFKTYVVSSELTSHVEKQAKLKDLSTL
jgi:hypothetical protein